VTSSLCDEFTGSRPVYGSYTGRCGRCVVYMGPGV